MAGRWMEGFPLHARHTPAGVFSMEPSMWFTHSRRRSHVDNTAVGSRRGRSATWKRLRHLFVPSSSSYVARWCTPNHQSTMSVKTTTRVRWPPCHNHASASAKSCKNGVFFNLKWGKETVNMSRGTHRRRIRTKQENARARTCNSRLWTSHRLPRGEHKERVPCRRQVPAIRSVPVHSPSSSTPGWCRHK